MTPDNIGFNADGYAAVGNADHLARVLCRTRTGHECASVDGNFCNVVCGCGHWPLMRRYADAAMIELGVSE